MSILIVGDLMVDDYRRGRVSRVSPEAPVLVHEWDGDHDFRLGGAANVAANVRSLGETEITVGVVGYDVPGHWIREQFGLFGIVVDCSRPTTVKTRYVTETGQHLLRVDHERREPIGDDIVRRIRDGLPRHMDGVRAAVVSDYAKGIVTEALFQFLADLCRERGVPLIVDPKRRDLSFYRGATVIKPNENEISADWEQQSADTGATLVVTRGAEGMLVCTPKRVQKIPPHPVGEVVDVVGAGDVVTAALAVRMAKGDSIVDACHYAARAAAVSVQRRGTVAVSELEVERG